MENHRLTEMRSGYDEKLFNQIYQSTENLRNSLSRQINPRRYGVTDDIIKSWFDDKFVFVFNKYYGQISNDQLKAYFKYRVLRNAYIKSNIFNDSVYIEDNFSMINVVSLEEDRDEKDMLLNLAMGLLKKELTPDAFLILEIDLNPPPYITTRVKSYRTKIPAKLIAEYLDLDIDCDGIRYVEELRKEVREAIKMAKTHFTNFSYN
jgi:hypothetical protein